MDELQVEHATLSERREAVRDQPRSQELAELLDDFESWGSRAVRRLRDVEIAVAGSVPIEDQIEAVEREIRMRRRVYPGLVTRNRMGEDEAEREIAAMESVLRTLRQLVQPQLL